MMIAGLVSFIAANPVAWSVATTGILGSASAQWGTTEVVRSLVLCASCIVVVLFLRLIGERAHELRVGRLPSTGRLLFLDVGIALLAFSEVARQASSIHTPFRWWVPFEGIGLVLVIIGVFALEASFEHRRKFTTQAVEEQSERDDERDL